ncbi:MAG TPA: M14 family zinc carboxypeptidase [Candidatus Elarobacter sp.]|jgi:murein tripeptide amidase MpaA|nr:M14 family zinc carboxypeptidase [Candidatus Elarobacter sp.]
MYLNVDEVDTAVKNLATTYPALCTLITLPNKTFEMRTTHALRLGGGAAGSRDCVLVLGGIHAREWGSPEILLGFAADLLEAYTTSTGLGYGGKSFTAAEIKTLLDTLHLIVFPLANPDGRHYSQVNDDPTVNGGWRRNRNTTNSGGQADCIGVDVNRNYDFLFDFATAFSPMSLASTYTSADPCNTNQVYHGPAPFSEPESSNVKWLFDTNPRTRWFLDVHSYSEDILYSWGDDDDQSTNPAMNFQNHAYDGQRGLPSDAAYNEFIHGDDKAVAVTLANTFHDALQAVRAKDYTVKSSFQLYPTAGASDDYAYARHIVDPSKGKIYAYTIEWGTEFHPPWAEMANIVKDVDAGLIAFCLAAPCAGGVPALWLETPSLVFEAVPAGVQTTRAAVFSVQSCAAVDLNVTSGPVVLTGPGSFGLPLGNASLSAAPNAGERDVRIWVSFTGTNAGDMTTGTMTVHCPQTGDDFVIPISAHTIAQPKVAAMMVLDRSGSMDDPSGVPGQKRIDVLHASAPGFVALLSDADGIGIDSFDQDAHPVMPVTVAGAMGSGTGRTNATNAIAAHATNPAGTTSIGDGVELAHTTLAPVGGYDSKAIVVFTDGEENTYKYISDVIADIDDRVFAIGLGTADEVNPVALNALVNKTGGYLLLTDQLGPNDQFRLAKYFVQILAGVTNAEIVVDPQGVLVPGPDVRIPFDLNEADYGADAIVLSPAPGAMRFQVETPGGVRIDHAALGGTVGVHYATGVNMAFYRLSLPVLAGGASAARGRWHVVLGEGKETPGISAFASAGGRAIPYSVVVHARSALTMAAYVTQPSYVAPTTLHLRAVLTEIGLPLEGRAHVRAEVRRPDGTSAVVNLAETDAGVFEASTPAALNGIYPIRFRANGTTLRGFPFTREQTRTAMAWRGGNDPLPHAPPTGDWCGLLRCLLSDRAIQAWLEKHGIDPKTAQRCLEGACPKTERS